MSQEMKDNKEYRRLVEQETLIFEVTEAIAEVLDGEGRSKSDLARALGRTKGFVSQLLSGSRNMTLRTVADLAFALDRRFKIDLVPLDLDDGSVLRATPRMGPMNHDESGRRLTVAGRSPRSRRGDKHRLRHGRRGSRLTRANVPSAHHGRSGPGGPAKTNEGATSELVG
jgi:transcriptional regulator with XRE-family HTH domain